MHCFYVPFLGLICDCVWGHCPLHLPATPWGRIVCRQAQITAQMVRQDLSVLTSAAMGLVRFDQCAQNGKGAMACDQLF